MSQFKVFSKVEIQGAQEDQQVWKCRGDFVANNAREAMAMAAEVDALTSEPGTSKIYSAADRWQESEFSFFLTASVVEQTRAE